MVWGGEPVVDESWILGGQSISAEKNWYKSSGVT